MTSIIDELRVEAEAQKKSSFPKRHIVTLSLFNQKRGAVDVHKEIPTRSSCGVFQTHKQ